MTQGKMTAFQQALLDSILMEYQDVPHELELENIFSYSFQQWANEFLAEYKTRKRKSHRLARIILVAAILVVILVGTAFAIPAIREAIIEYFFQCREEAIGISFDSTASKSVPLKIETIYVLEYIPEDYYLVLDSQSPARGTMWWKNDIDHWIYYTQHIIPSVSDNSLWMGLGSAQDGKKMMLIGDYIVDLIQKEETYILVWTNNEYFFTLELPNTIDYETMVQIFMRWKPVA